ncbi:peptidase inhibitor family I36 protein [Microbacterium phyllosphaerae]|uniref:peptidase inhibitor family I36 protein n=1 Tax=Microbacterium phyllosphaerae TaxID=124798 RepID=UPI000EA0D679|nr:peptidase inhibitor family I36 protein [Microbacterium phyllosphaerae]
MKRIVTTLVVAGLALALVPAAANASDELHPDVEYALETVPGGIALSDTEVLWPALGMLLEAEIGPARAVGSCATGMYCAFTGSNLSGTRLSFTVCTNVSTAALQNVGSIANGRSSGLVRARNSAAAVLGTAAPNGSANVGLGTTSLLCTL